MNFIPNLEQYFLQSFIFVIGCIDFIIFCGRVWLSLAELEPGLESN